MGTLNMPMSLREKITSYAADGRRAYKIVGALFAEIIATLRRDPRLHELSVFDLELLLADARANAERQLVYELRDRIHIDHIEDE
jgi:hypothetical protein